MRLLELILFSLALVEAAILFTSGLKRYRAKKYIPFINFAVFILHWNMEGIRWQLYPLYLLLTVYILLFAMDIIYTNFLNTTYKLVLVRVIVKGISLLLIIISTAAAYLFPVYNMKKPNGQYKIGTLTFDAIDKNREAIYSSGRYENRRLRIQVWYPSDNTKGYERSSWIQEGKIVAEAVSRMMELPDFLLSHAALIKSNSYKDAEVSKKKDKYPVIILSHGVTGFRCLHADVAEMLASNGYIVASINHTYGAAITVFEDGEVAMLNREALPWGIKQEDFLEYAHTLIDTYAGDIQFTMDKLEELNEGRMSKILKNRIDTTRMGVLGHSTGGGAAVMTGLRDNRTKAIMGFDPWMEPLKDEEIQSGLDIPALYLRSEQWETVTDNTNLFSILSSSRNYGELYQINGSKHLDFTMIYMFSTLSKNLGFSGEINGWKGASIQQDFVLNFFNKYLLHESDSPNAEDVSSKYEEVIKVN